MTPEGFWHLTPDEFFIKLESVKNQELNTLRVVSLIVSELNAVHVKRPRSAEWYFKRWTKTEPELKTKADKKAAIERLKQKRRAAELKKSFASEKGS